MNSTDRTRVIFEDIGDRLEAAAEKAREQVVIVAPFIRYEPFERIVGRIGRGVRLKCITRWRLDEVARGVSEPEIWSLIRERSEASLWLRRDLHAKYYRFDKEVYYGSSNLTEAGLGWGQRPNLEVVTTATFSQGRDDSFENFVTSGALRVNDQIYQDFLELVSEFEGEVVDLDREGASTLSHVNEPAMPVRSVSSDHWLPKLRHPSALYDAYRDSDSSHLTLATRSQANYDLRYFDIPDGLKEGAFERIVGWQLLQMPAVQLVDKFVAKPRRFGAVEALLDDNYDLQGRGRDSSEVWQVLMRWLLYFSKERYRQWTPNYSELFVRCQD